VNQRQHSRGIDYTRIKPEDMRHRLTIIENVTSGSVPRIRVLSRLYNFGNQRSIELASSLEILEDCLGRKAVKNLLPLQPGEVPDTLADVEALNRDVGYRPGTPIEKGAKRFVEWHLSYYRPGVA
jgi:nucleoside-diphosphate-sugar epimerase